MIFLEPVAVAASVSVDPSGRQGVGRIKVPFHKVTIASAHPGRMKRNEIKGRRVRGSIIGRVRDQFEMGEFPASQLMMDFTRFGITVVVPLGRLPLCEDLQSAEREFGIARSRSVAR